MRLEYTEEQEKELRMTELEAILENELYESNVEKYCLEIELQFLEGSKNVFGDPAAFIDADKISFEIIYEEESEDYSATLYNKNGEPRLPYLNHKDLYKLVEEIIDKKYA